GASASVRSNLSATVQNPSTVPSPTPSMATVIALRRGFRPRTAVAKRPVGPVTRASAAMEGPEEVEDRSGGKCEPDGDQRRRHESPGGRVLGRLEHESDGDAGPRERAQEPWPDPRRTRQLHTTLPEDPRRVDAGRAPR